MLCSVGWKSIKQQHEPNNFRRNVDEFFFNLVDWVSDCNEGNHSPMGTKVLFGYLMRSMKHQADRRKNVRNVTLKIFIE